ncbi:hypothetical protein GEMRC1_007703 [Eukaryota sp. GEM-RC1]
MSLYELSGRFQKQDIPEKAKHQFVMWLTSKIETLASSSVDVPATVNRLLTLSNPKQIESFLLSRLGRRPEVFYFAQEFLTQQSQLYSSKSFVFEPNVQNQRKQSKQKTHTLTTRESLKGRECGCNCTIEDHLLIGNCTNCGRIACSAEGNTCFTCGKYIAGDIQSSLSTPASTKLDLKETQAEISAQQYLTKLLEFQKTSEERTAVIDDQGDGAVRNPEVDKEVFLEFSELF